MKTCNRLLWVSIILAIIHSGASYRLVLEKHSATTPESVWQDRHRMTHLINIGPDLVK